jgi:divalent metal cation (Fe/Co/Zn/Cd) transporter
VASGTTLGAVPAAGSDHAEHGHGHAHGHSHDLAVVAAIFLSACFAGYEAIDRLVDPRQVDAYVSLAVIASAAVVSLGLEVADPLIGLAITLVILRITLHSWRTVR